MCIWPWSTIARLERETQKLRSQLATEKLMRELSEIAKDTIIEARRRHVEGLWLAVAKLEEIASMVTPGANGTVRRMARAAEDTIARIQQEEPHLFERLKSNGGKAVSYDQEAPEVSSNG